MTKEDTFKQIAESLRNVAALLESIQAQESQGMGNIDYAELASEVSLSDIAAELDVSEVAEHLNAEDIASHVEVEPSEVADHIDYKQLAREMIRELQG